jgi:hypothetical protein
MEAMHEMEIDAAETIVILVYFNPAASVPLA